VSLRVFSARERPPGVRDYRFPRGLATVHIDLDADRGVYWEPNVRMVHGVS
jgi:hypothetical protein